MTPSRRRTFALSSAVAPLLAMWASTWLACTPANTAGGARVPTPRPVRPFVRYERPSGDPYTDRFLALWNDIHNPENGYFSPEGIPYHSVETLLCEAPDYGHETTSEAYSYWLWLEAMYGRVTKDWSYLDEAWRNTEAFMIPTAADQPTTAAYDPTKPAMFAPELDHPTKYPAAFVPVTVGADPLASELRQTYGDSNIYLMHWLMDVDNWYGFGRRGDPKARAAFINTFQRGPEESVWETIPQPSWDEMKFGGSRGYLDLFVKDSDTPQWKYTVAPDADARAVQAVYWAKRWAEESNSSDAAVQGLVTKAAKLGDYLRYALFDKYFKPLGCTSPDCPAGGGRTAAHYLVSWFTAWGGSISGPAWSWRIASSAAHQGYQNPMAAYALSSVPDMRPRSPTAWGDWARSLSRQLELYRWLQSSEGAIAGGVNNCWNGAYGTPPAGTPTFYGMAYDESPVYRDPSSNEWFGFQTWSMERVAELYYVTADKRAEAVLSKWVAWVLKSSSLTPDGFAIPGTLGWSGRPSASWDEKRQSFDPKDATFNAGLHVTVKDTNEDVASAASLAKTLSFWAARSGDTAARAFAKGLLDRMWTKYRDAKGVAAKEARKDYKRFNDPLVVPAGWKGKMPNGAAIDASSTFVSIRSKYKSDPDWPRVESYLRGGEPPSFVYHRFWAQAEIATSNAVYGWLFPSGTKGTGSSGGAGAQHAAPTASPQSPTTTASK